MPQLFVPIGVPLVDKQGQVTTDWQYFFQRLTQAVPSTGAGDVTQDGSVVVGHVAVFASDKHIEDGGAVPAGTVTTTPTVTTGVMVKFSGATSITNTDAAAVSAALDLLP